MILQYLIAFLIVSLVIGLIWIMRKPIVKRLVRLNTKLQFESLRSAIKDADADKTKTGRKNIVVFDTDTREFVPVHKRKLKIIAGANKPNNNAAQTPGRKWAAAVAKNKKRIMNHERVRKIEKSSPYVTDYSHE